MQHFMSMIFLVGPGRTLVSVHMDSAGKNSITKGVAVDVLTAGSASLERMQKEFAAAARRVQSTGASLLGEAACFEAGGMALLLGHDDASDTDGRAEYKLDGSWLRAGNLTYSKAFEITVRRAANGVLQPSATFHD
jgi:hypothetical protein